MAAVAYKVTVVVENPQGSRKNFALTASDVNAAYWLGQDGDANIIFSNVSGGTIVDVIYTTTGTDTSQVAIYKNSKDTGDRIINASNGPTVLSRQMQSTRVTFNAGDKFRFQQLT